MQKCPLGKISYTGAPNLVGCQLCDKPGFYIDEEGKGFFKIAGPGTIPNEERTGLVNCTENTFTVGSSDTCTPCPTFAYSDPGSSTCSKCTTGQYFNETSRNCESYPSGKFSLSGATSIEFSDGYLEGYYSCEALGTVPPARPGLTSRRTQTLACSAQKESGAALDSSKSAQTVILGSSLRYRVQRSAIYALTT